MHKDHREAHGVPTGLNPGAARLAPWLQEARALITLSVPVTAMQLAMMGSLTADIIMVGGLGKDALASISIASVVFYLTWLIGYGPVAAISPSVAYILGAHPRDRARVRATVRMGLWAVIALSLPLVAALAWTGEALVLLGQDARIAATAQAWASAIAWGLPFALGFAALRSFATAIGHQRAVVVIAAASVGVNIAGNWVFIYGNLGAPALGVQGSGFASALSSVFQFSTMLAVCTWGRAFRPYRILHRFGRPDWARFAGIFRLGVPIGLSSIFEAMLFNAATLLMGTFGAATVAAHQIALNFASVAFMVPLGIGMAATVRVGLHMGAGDGVGARRAGRTAMLCGAAFSMICAALMALVPGLIISAYVPANDPANAEVVPLAINLLGVAALFQLVDSLQVTGQMSLRGLKDATVPMWIAGLSYWLVGFCMAWALAFWAGWGGVGVWLGLAAGLTAAAVGMIWRFEVLSARLVAAGAPAAMVTGTA